MTFRQNCNFPAQSVRFQTSAHKRRPQPRPRPSEADSKNVHSTHQDGCTFTHYQAYSSAFHTRRIPSTFIHTLPHFVLHGHQTSHVCVTLLRVMSDKGYTKRREGFRQSSDLFRQSRLHKLTIIRIRNFFTGNSKDKNSRFF